MIVRKFKDVRFKGDWENNYIGRKWNLRVGRSQVALWWMWNHRPINLFHPINEFRYYRRNVVNKKIYW